MRTMLEDRDAVNRPRGRLGGAGATVALTAMVLALGACSYVPDWANPVQWYDTVMGDDVPPPPVQPAPEPTAETTGQEQSFPNLSQVPEKPETGDTAEQRQAVAQGLVADRDKARYTDETLRANPAAPPAAPTLTAPPPPAPSATPEPAQPIAVRSASAPPPPPPTTVTAPQPVPPLVPSAAPPPAAPAAAAMPAAMPATAPPAVGSDQSALAQAFSQGLAESAATVVTTPTHAGFQPTTAQPMAPQTVPVSNLARENYNESLTRKPAEIPQTVASLAPPPETIIGPSGAVNGTPAVVVLFNNGSAALSAQARARLKDLAAAQKAKNGHVRVIGHASQRTKDLPIEKHMLVNFNLSVDRAQAVAAELMRDGVPSTSIVVEARGAADPVYYEWMPEGEAQNRRADVYLEN